MSLNEALMMNNVYNIDLR